MTDRTPTTEAHETGGSCVVEKVSPAHARCMKTVKLPRPYCRGIDPESDGAHYYCRNCGYGLVETKAGWFRHGDQWRHPQVWTSPREDRP